MVVRSPGSGINNITSSVLTIRNFRSSDLQRVIPLVEVTFNETYDHDLYLNMARRWPEGQLVAERGDELVGFLMSTEQRPYQARVLILCIKEGNRGMGIGRALMRTIMNRAALEGHRSMTLEVRVSNERGLAFYARLGFEMIGLIPNFYPDGESAFLLKKVLS
jgi:ribosomal-protein-alanine N-acetyltransferase